MIGNYAFCHRSGAPLSEPTHYDDYGRAYRSVLSEEEELEGEEEAAEDGDSDRPVGELTNGEVRSSRRAFITYFRRTHRHHDEFDTELYTRAALAVRRLKRSATSDQEADQHVWYALQYRLDECGYETEWMHAHAGIHCPGCHGRLNFREDDTGVVRARCGTDCDGTSGDQLQRIRELVASLYNAAFEGPRAHADDVLQF